MTELTGTQSITFDLNIEDGASEERDASLASLQDTSTTTELSDVSPSPERVLG